MLFKGDYIKWHSKHKSYTQCKHLIRIYVIGIILHYYLNSVFIVVLCKYICKGVDKRYD